MNHLHLPPHVCRRVAAARQREWLVTNNIGGFACGTVADVLTRRYHGLLIAALEPPLGRQLLAAKLDTTALIGRQHYQLYTNHWRSGLEQPTACAYLERFDLLDNVPTWTFELGPVRLIRRIWMEPGHNVTYVQFECISDAPTITLAARLLANDRDYHHLTSGTPGFQVHATDNTLIARGPYTATPLHVRCINAPDRAATWQIDHTWCHDLHLPVEAARGFDHLESHLVVGLCTTTLAPGGTTTFIISAGEADVDVSTAHSRRRQHAHQLLATWHTHTEIDPQTTPLPVRQLVLAADQFVVRRQRPDAPDGHTILAGYPWFTDWGRDTMIALPGLTLTTGRHDIAREILCTWAHYVHDGLIPNRFPDRGETPEYHTADATLWYLWAIDQYIRTTGDIATLGELFPVMQAIIDAHLRGTRHNIRVHDDGLVYAGEEGVNLTWMDAKVGNQVVTPRMGKPIELSALWFDALCNLARLSDLLENPGHEYVRLAAITRRSFQRFWNPDRNCCFDVLDGPAGNDATIRPNQVFAVSLTHSPLERSAQEAVVQTCEEQLFGWFGLRSLAPSEPGYASHYTGNPAERDSVYHQGTVWGWLLGPFVIAHHRVHKDPLAARQFLAPMLGQLWTHGVGSLSEIFDGAEPHAPRGCISQAWSVAETLRAWHFTQGRGTAPATPR